MLIKFTIDSTVGFNFYASICFKDPGSTGYPGTPTPTSPLPTGTGTLRYYQSTVILNIKNLHGVLEVSKQ